ncbi:hypothetical protein TRIATDRAFT_84963 [Trichoderma atroviride IMI 206040]|uniref:Uncharacterized protein n=1 Tax=Hypocrea atroviridis (strain ATCC 20476 / IMI 206040) TaxID=452589 RepID=G9P4R8_HYPAI|nr:uncharacterized protein TRIATDRAFT_84963 [Trichoderma atroviride IMI 206040]EHK41213.1 hypothetical protein TRIATDRAFT_84963 [Trichoderma atroviride IMI 206040]
MTGFSSPLLATVCFRGGEGPAGRTVQAEAVAPRARPCGKRVRTRSDKLQQADAVGPGDGKFGGLLQTSKWPAHQPVPYHQARLDQGIQAVASSRGVQLPRAKYKAVQYCIVCEGSGTLAVETGRGCLEEEGACESGEVMGASLCVRERVSEKLSYLAGMARRGSVGGIWDLTWGLTWTHAGLPACLLVHAQAVRRREKVFQHSVPSLCDVGVEHDKQWATAAKDRHPRRGTAKLNLQVLVITSDAHEEKEKTTRAQYFREPCAIRKKPPLPRPMWLSRIIRGHRLRRHTHLYLYYTVPVLAAVRASSRFRRERRAEPSKYEALVRGNLRTPAHDGIRNLDPGLIKCQPQPSPLKHTVSGAWDYTGANTSRGSIPQKEQTSPQGMWSFAAPSQDSHALHAAAWPLSTLVKGLEDASVERPELASAIFANDAD